MNVTPLAEARIGLSRVVADFRMNPGADPVVIGSHRKAEAVLLPFAQYQRLAKSGDTGVTIERLRSLADLTERWLDELDRALVQAARLVERGEDIFHADPAIPLAFEALSNRVGDLAKRLRTADPQRFAHPSWRAAARHRDFVVHDHDRMDSELLWRTVTVSFPELAGLLREARQND